MGLIDYAVIGVIALILGAAGWYVYKAKKSGKKCIGCPHSGKCGATGCNACSCGDLGENTQ